MKSRLIICLFFLLLICPVLAKELTREVIHKNIDVHVQYTLQDLSREKSSLLQEFAHDILGDIKGGDLGGAYLEDQQVPAMRAVAVGTWWGTLIPKGEHSILFLPVKSHEKPILVFDKEIRNDKKKRKAALVDSYALFQAFLGGYIVRCDEGSSELVLDRVKPGKWCVNQEVPEAEIVLAKFPQVAKKKRRYARNCGFFTTKGELYVRDGSPDDCSCRLWKDGDDPAFGCTGKSVSCEDINYQACPNMSGIGCGLPGSIEDIFYAPDRKHPTKFLVGNELSGTVHDMCCATQYKEVAKMQGLRMNGCLGPAVKPIRSCKTDSDCNNRCVAAPNGTYDSGCKCVTVGLKQKACTREVGTLDNMPFTFWSSRGEPGKACYKEWFHANDMNNDLASWAGDWYSQVDTQCRWDKKGLIQYGNDTCKLPLTQKAPNNTYIGEADWVLKGRHWYKAVQKGENGRRVQKVIDINLGLSNSTVACLCRSGCFGIDNGNMYCVDKKSKNAICKSGPGKMY